MDVVEQVHPDKYSPDATGEEEYMKETSDTIRTVNARYFDTMFCETKMKSSSLLLPSTGLPVIMGQVLIIFILCGVKFYKLRGVFHNLLIYYFKKEIKSRIG